VVNDQVYAVFVALVFHVDSIPTIDKNQMSVANTSQPSRAKARRGKPAYLQGLKPHSFRRVF
jgi:hypothetical protein